MLCDAPARDRAKKGAAALDERFPGWHDMIDATILDISSGSDCVLGQLYGSWTKARAATMTTWTASDLGNLGFLQRRQVGEIEEAWRDEIFARRMADAKREDREAVLSR